MTLTTKAGLQVPWVTRWTKEVIRSPIQLTYDPANKTPVLFYDDGPEFRDEHGILWQREGINRGGEPQFSQVATYRQRAAMRKRLCQVCGNKIESRVIRWLMAPLQLETLGGATCTQSPPTCDACVPIAIDLCPRMRQEHIILRVLEYRIWGVSGEAVVLREPEQPLLGVRQVNAAAHRYGDPYPLAFLAKQQIVELVKFVPEAS